MSDSGIGPKNLTGSPRTTRAAPEDQSSAETAPARFCPWVDGGRAPAGVGLPRRGLRRRDVVLGSACDTGPTRRDGRLPGSPAHPDLALGSDRAGAVRPLRSLVLPLDELGAVPWRRAPGRESGPALPAALLALSDPALDPGGSPRSGGGVRRRYRCHRDRPRRSLRLR